MPMPGYLHIFRTRESGDSAASDYQVNYVIPGSSFMKLVPGDNELARFLLEVAEVPSGEIDRALGELRDSGRTNIAEVDIPLSEASALGLLRVPSDE
jgi:hypothetical protein